MINDTGDFVGGRDTPRGGVLHVRQRKDFKSNHFGSVARKGVRRKRVEKQRDEAKSPRTPQRGVVGI